MYRLRPMNPEQMRQVDAAIVLEGGFDAILVAVMRRLPPPAPQA